MDLESVSDSVESYFLAMNLEYSKNNTFEILDLGDRRKFEFKIKYITPMLVQQVNDKIGELLYLESGRLKFKVQKIMITSEAYNRARFNCSAAQREKDFISFEFKVSSHVEVIRALDIFEELFISFFVSERII